MVHFAHRLADAAALQTMRRWTVGCAAEDKGGAEFDPVTEADREAERAMRSMIEDEWPEHGISGEEFPDRTRQGPLSWSVDPIDGTRSFICGLPTWVTLIALLQDGQPILGVIDAPCLGERYVGLGDGGTLFAEGAARPLRASACFKLGDARFSTTDPFLFRGSDSEAFHRVRERVRTTRYGHDGYAYACLARGSIDLVVETGLKPHDYDALIPVIRAAGGVVTDWYGGTDFAAGRVVAAATPQLLNAAIEAMQAS